MGEPSTEWLHSRSTPSSMLLHRSGLTTSWLKAPSSTGQTTTTVRTSTCPAEEPHRIKHREPLTVGTPRSRITPLEKNQAWVDQSLAISPRWCGREALMLELVYLRREARWWLWPTIRPPETLVDSMLTTFLHPNREVLSSTLIWTSDGKLM